MALDLHRHDEFSSFDGFGKALDLVRIAEKQGITALGIANHGNMNGIIEHWLACKQTGIKPILGIEAYFQPKFNKHDPKPDSFHLCLFASNLQGYKNLNRIMSISSIEQKYKKPICDFDLLEKYSEGVFTTSGCIASFISQSILNGKLDIAEKAIKKFISIFGRDNFYVEIQPYSVSEKGLQERLNVQLIKLAMKLDLKMVLTSDSHYGAKNDYDTYMKMHQMKSSDDFAGDTYAERYMPAKDDLGKRFLDMHSNDFKNPYMILNRCLDGLDEIEEKVDGEILDKLELKLPKLSEGTSDNSVKTLMENIKQGLREKDKYEKKYLQRCKQEYDVIVHHGFEDYFLVVQDYVKWAKARGIKVGPGRGSVCNSAVAYALDITEVDSVYFDLDFTRFLRMDKKKLPDIDLDFETDRRDEVIDYIVKKYPGKAAQICSYGLYKVDNLLNDLFKVCGVEQDSDKKDIKQWVSKNVIDDAFDYDSICSTNECKYYNKRFDDIVKHFSKMFKKVRYIGTHAAGVAVAGGDLLDYVSLESRGGKLDKETGERLGYKISTAYDLNNLEAINVVKFDVLGLRTLSVTKELEEMTNECFNYKWLEDEEVYEYFREGKTEGIFQFERGTAKDILIKIGTDSFNDVVAASALNRPGPLSLKMPDQYAHNKYEDNNGNEPWKRFTDKTYGTIVYQEQVTSICREIGLMEPSDADKILKFMKGTQMTESAIRMRETEEKRLREIFRAGAKKTCKMTIDEADDLFDKITIYTFNEGHSTGYSLVSLQQMYYKVKHPVLFWYVTLKYASDDASLARLKVEAVKEGNVILLPHVNYGSEYKIVTLDGQKALAEGLVNIKNVGEKAANLIEGERLDNGPFKNIDDFIDRTKSRIVNKRVIDALTEHGALEFNKKVYLGRVVKYNSTLYLKGSR